MLTVLLFMQKDLQNLEDASDELLMVEDSLISYPLFNTKTTWADFFWH